MGPTGESGLRKALDDSDPDVQRVLPQLFASGWHEGQTSDSSKP